MGLGVVWQPEGACLLRGGDPRVWLRAIRAAERGRDGGIGIAVRVVSKPAAAPRPPPLSASPVKNRVLHAPLVPHGAQFPMATLSPLPWGHSVVKASRTPLLSLGSAVARLLLCRSRYRSPLFHAPILSSLQNILTLSRCPQDPVPDLSHTNHFFSQLLSLS